MKNGASMIGEPRNPTLIETEEFYFLGYMDNQTNQFDLYARLSQDNMVDVVLINNQSGHGQLYSGERALTLFDHNNSINPKNDWDNAAVEVINRVKGLIRA